MSEQTDLTQENSLETPKTSERMVRVEGSTEAAQQLQELWQIVDDLNLANNTRFYRRQEGEHRWKIDVMSTTDYVLSFFRRAKSADSYYVNDVHLSVVRPNHVRVIDISNMPLDRASIKSFSDRIQENFTKYGAFGREEPKIEGLGFAVDFDLEEGGVTNPKVYSANAEGDGTHMAMRHSNEPFEQTHFDRFREKIAEVLQDVKQIASSAK